jgi:probable F420-dependent oxidoreductase
VTKEHRVRIGFALPQFGAPAHQADQVAGFARNIEAMGGDGLWVGDRLLAPVNPTVGYGGGTTIPEAFHAVLDPFVLLTIAATVTERVQIGSNVLNAPWYAPAVLARALTSIDLVSRGRLVVGLGIGWSPEEYEAAGIPMNERGARLDECLDALEALWTTDPAEYHGEHWSVPATHANLKPAQTPRPPLYLAGFAPKAMNRTALRADGWLPVYRPGMREFDPQAFITKPLGRIRQLAEEGGRDPQSIGAILRVYPTETGTVEQCAETLLRAEAEAGIDNAFVDLFALADSVKHMEELAERVLGLVRRG